MKKVMTTLALVLVTLAMSAQTAGVKIAPKYQKGDNMLYRTTGTMNIQGQVVNIMSDTRFVVTEATPEGYTIEATLENVDTDAKDFMGRMMQLTQSVAQGVKTIYTTDADGQLTGIKNYAEVKEKTMAAIDKMVEGMLQEMPEASQVLTPDALKKQIAESLTEERLLNQLKGSPSAFSLNGKTITTGAMDEGTNESGMKVKNMYFLSQPDASKVKVTTTLNMSKDDIKKMIVEKVRELMPQQAEMVEQNIDQLMASGMLKMDFNRTSDYELLPSGWVKSVVTKQTQNNTGQAVELQNTMTLVESNR